MTCPNCKCASCKPKPKQPEDMSWVSKYKCEAKNDTCDNQAVTLEYYTYYYGHYGDSAEGTRLVCEEHKSWY